MIHCSIRFALMAESRAALLRAHQLQVGMYDNVFFFLWDVFHIMEMIFSIAIQEVPWKYDWSCDNVFFMDVYHKKEMFFFSIAIPEVQ